MGIYRKCGSRICINTHFIQRFQLFATNEFLFRQRVNETWGLVSKFPQMYILSLTLKA